MEDLDVKAWCPLDPETAPIISSLRMNVSLILEMSGEPPPVMFGNYAFLEYWAMTHGLKSEKIDGIRKISAVRIRGFFEVASAGVRFGYDQIWAKAKYSRYRSALEKIGLAYGIGRGDWGRIHADHVINRARLKGIPDAWVAIFPVFQDANCAFGKIEKSLLPITPGTSRINLPQIAAYKLFCGKLPRTREEFEQATLNIRGNFLVNYPHVEKYYHEICSEARKCIVD